MASSSSGDMEIEQLTSGASNRIIPILKSLRAAFIFVYSFFFSFLLFVLPRPRRIASPPSSPRKSRKRRSLCEEEDTLRRRALAEDVIMVRHDDVTNCRWTTSLFYGLRSNALFCRSWFPLSHHIK